MSYEQAEEDIFQRLFPLEGANIEVVKLPQAQADFERPFVKSKVTIGYKGSKWDKPKSTAEISQDEEVMFEFAIQSRTLRGSKGVYILKKFIIEALVGFRPTSMDKMYCHESGLTNAPTTFKDGVWTYSLVMCGRNLTVEDFEEDLSVILKQITNKDATLGGEFTVLGETLDVSLIN